MLPSDALWPAVKPPTFERVGTTQPFNYRDTLSLLDYVNQIVKHVESLQSDIDADLTSIDGDLGQMQTALSGIIVDMVNMRDQLISLIQQAESSGNIMVWSPAYGTHVSIQQALEDIYDADRPFGLFVDDFDNLGLSPQDFDALGVSPRIFDLVSTAKINAIEGSISSDDILWLTPDTPTQPPSAPGINQLKQIFLQKNPTAYDFSDGR